MGKVGESWEALPWRGLGCFAVMMLWSVHGKVVKPLRARQIHVNASATFGTMPFSSVSNVACPSNV
jgi:hypothetical protein